MFRCIRAASTAALFLSWLTLAVPAAAQTTTGTIVGTVTDETGGALPGVTVVVTNTETSLTRTFVSDANGRYAAANLPPGAYELKGSLQGFGSVLRRGITLSVGREAVIDFTLKLGEMASEVTVVAEAPSIELKASNTGSLITGGQIENIPLNGRSYVELTTLTPGRADRSDGQPEHEQRLRRQARRQRRALHVQPVHAGRHQHERRIQSGGQRLR